MDGIASPSRLAAMPRPGARIASAKTAGFLRRIENVLDVFFDNHRLSSAHCPRVTLAAGTYLGREAPSVEFARALELRQLRQVVGVDLLQAEVTALHGAAVFESVQLQWFQEPTTDSHTSEHAHTADEETEHEQALMCQGDPKVEPADSNERRRGAKYKKKPKSHLFEHDAPPMPWAEADLDRPEACPQ